MNRILTYLTWVCVVRMMDIHTVWAVCSGFLSYANQTFVIFINYIKKKRKKKGSSGYGTALNTGCRVFLIQREKLIVCDCLPLIELYTLDDNAI